ncbi:MAG TPA: hypothetical protein DCZ62_00925 [Ruminococcus sp.]|nr:hypothetical protein [Ruminococcus sp.]
MKAKRYLAAAAAAVLAVSSIPSAFTANADALLPGDVTMDGEVGLQDVAAVRQYLDGDIELTPAELELANVYRPDSSGVDFYDFCALFNYDSRAIDQLPYDGTLNNVALNAHNSWEIQSDLIMTENRLAGVSLVLDGKIGLKFHAQLDSEATRVVLSGPDGKVKFTDLESCKTIDPETGAPIYQFTYYVNATQADADITMQVFYSNIDSQKMDIEEPDGSRSEDFTVHRCVNDYLEAYEYNGGNADALVSALDNYTKAASNFFNGTDYTISGIGAVDLNELEQFKPDFSDEDAADGDPSSNIKLSLILNSATTLRLYWDLIDKGDEAKLFDVDAFVALDDLTAVYDSKKDKTYFEITDIPAGKLTEQYRLTYGCDLYFNPMSYVYRVLLAEQNGDPIATPQLVDLAKSLYVYARAAYNYSY